MKKLMSVMLAVMMLLMPVMGLAACGDAVVDALEAGRRIETVVSVEAVGMPEEIQSMLPGLTLSVQAGENPEQSLTVKVAGMEIRALTLAEDDELVYLASDLLGDQPIAVGMEDLDVLVERVVNLLEMMGIPATEMLASLEEEVAAMMSATETLPLFELMSWGQELVERIEYAEVTAQPRNSDPAVQKASIQLTKEDMEKLLGFIFGQLIDEETYNSAIALIEAYDERIEMYLDEAGEPVYMTGYENFTMDGSATKSDINYARLTIDEGVTHAANVIATTEDGELSVSISVLAKENGVVVHLDAAFDGAPVLGVAFAMDKADQDVDLSLVLDAYEDGESVGTMTVLGKITTVCEGVDFTNQATFEMTADGETVVLRVNTMSCDPVAQLDKTNALRLAQISEEDFQVWFVGVLNTFIMMFGGME